MTPALIPPRDITTAFSAFLNAPSLSLGGIGPAILFDIPLEFYPTVRLEQCSAPDDGHPHCKVFETTFYFGRLMRVSTELTCEEDVGENVGYREKWALTVQPVEQAFALTADVPNINLFGSEFGNIGSFTEAVRALPIVQWAAAQGTAKATAALDRSADHSSSHSSRLIARQNSALNQNRKQYSRYGEPKKPGDPNSEAQGRPQRS